MARVTVVDAGRLADAAAEHLAARIEQAIAARGSAQVSLTGGHTPEQAYAALADRSRPYRQQIDWSRVHLFWGDERHVPPEHPDSNFGMADRALLQHIPIPPAHIHRVHAEYPDPHAAAAEYSRELPERFDVMLLGLGEDCHIASIFPGSELVDDHGAEPASPADADLSQPSHHRDRVVAVFAPHLRAWRITMIPPVILESRVIVMLVGGKGKAAAVAAAIDAPLDVSRYPGQLVRESGDRVEWLIDRDAAGRLRG